MKKVIGILTVSLLSFSLFFTACDKTGDLNESSSEEVSLKSLEPEVVVRGEEGLWSKTVVEEIVKKKICRNEPVSGVIEFTYDGEWVATVDFGDGNCDGIATITFLNKEGEINTKEMPLDRLFPKKGNGHGKPGECENKPKLTKVIVEEIIKSEECQEPVSGIIEFYAEDVLVARVDFGNGECDGMATKCYFKKDGSEECKDISLEDLHTGREQGEGCHGDGDFNLRKEVVEEVVHSEECKEPVSGIVNFFKGEELAFQINFGDGQCDGMATKCWTNKEGVQECKDFELKHPMGGE